MSLIVPKKPKKVTKAITKRVKEYPTVPITWTPQPKIPVFSVEVYGDPDLGKTHFICTFPNVAIADTPSEGKAWIVMKKFNNPRWFRVKTFNDIRNFVNHCVNDPSIETVAIDSGADLQELAELEWLEETGKERVYPLFLWSQVWRKIDLLVKQVKDADKYVVVSGKLKDEFAGPPEKATRTGRRIRDGYKKFPYGLSIMLRLEKGMVIDGKRQFTEHVFGKVIKNNFQAFRVQKPYLFDVSYRGILNELLDPYCATYMAGKCPDMETLPCVLCKEYEAPDILMAAKEFLPPTQPKILGAK